MKSHPVRASLIMCSLLMASSHSAEEALPVGLLEFIGSMVETDGRLIDPLSLETPADVVLAEGPDGDMAEREKVEDKR